MNKLNKLAYYNWVDNHFYMRLCKAAVNDEIEIKIDEYGGFIFNRK